MTTARILNTGDLFLWNKSHLEYFNFSSGLLDHKFTLSYSGRHPVSVSEFLTQKLEKKNTSPREFRSALLANFKRSYTFYDYFDPNYFPVNNVLPRVNEEVVILLLKKFRCEQIVIVDIDNTENISLYSYNYSQGLQKEVHSTATSHNFSVTVSVDEILSTDVFAFINRFLKVNAQMNTAWLFTGESLFAQNDNMHNYLLKFFSQVDKKNLPLLNQVFLDKLNILNYLSLLPLKTTKEQLGLWFKKVPLTIFNWHLIPAQARISVTLSSGGRKQISPNEQGGNIFKFEEQGHFSILESILINKGYVWFWNNNDRKFFRNGSSSFKLPPLRNITVIDHMLSKAKYSLLKVKVSNKVHEGLEVGEVPKLGRKVRGVKEYREVFINAPGVDKKDLLLVNGQKILKDEVINKKRIVNFLWETKEYRAAVSGLLSTQNLDHNFLSIKTKDYIYKDITWLDSDVVTHRKKQTNEIELFSKALAIPLQTVYGPGYFGNLVCVNDFSSAREYAKSVAGIVLMCDFVLSAAQALELFNSGIKALLAPQITSSEKIPENYKQVFSYGQLTREHLQFPLSLQKYLYLNQDNLCYLDPITQELKLLVGNHENAKFSLNLNSISTYSKNESRKIRKGDNVLVYTNSRFFQQATVKHLEGRSLLLSNEAGRVWEESSDFVILTS